jgi:glycosyltransferase involved in cell wall biosynthesis
MTLTYAVVTPARDEAENLRRLASCMLAQTERPSEWIVVDNGSADETCAIVEALAEQHAWIRLVRRAGERQARPGGPVVRAFHAGLAALRAEPDVVVKLDADVSFEPDHFATLLAAFASRPRLGIAGGDCLELNDGAWLPVPVTGAHVRGAERAYRRECLGDVLPLEERMGWDGIDELRAAVHGWETEIVAGVRFLHHRPVGARDGGRARRWLAQGEGAHYMGYRPSYIALRTLRRMLREPAAAAMLWGYARAALRREPRYADARVRDELRRGQRLRELPLRAREALGRR